ncbi:36352_t:CDS:1, partial [Gigaspora margarita]
MHIDPNFGNDNGPTKYNATDRMETDSNIMIESIENTPQKTYSGALKSNICRNKPYAEDWCNATLTTRARKRTEQFNNQTWNYENTLISLDSKDILKKFFLHKIQTLSM